VGWVVGEERLVVLERAGMLTPASSLPPSLPPHASYTQTNQFDPAYGNPQLLLAVQLLLLLILNDLYVVVIVCFACLPFFLGPSLSLPPFHLPPPLSLP
jgi:hypothetical protein